MGARMAAAMITALALVLTFGLVASATANETTASDWGPGFRQCHGFTVPVEPGIPQSRAERLHVFAKGVPCSKAWRIQMEYWLAPRKRRDLT